MGVVYRADDSVLDREVAIKVLPQELASNAERLGRLRREAKMLASLNHPNIASIYSFETAVPESLPTDRQTPADRSPVAFLVMELVEGETLADLLSRGPLPQDRAIEIARQTADALEAAHERAVVHRDLKPANIKITPEGAAKVLDFGLAKVLTGSLPNGDATDLSASPTLTAEVSQPGSLLGTVAYMSPEQASGKPLDKRTDIWSFGCVLFEMLTGKHPFRSDSTTQTLADILNTDPQLDELHAELPTSVRSLVSRCLTKDPKYRLRDIGEARIVCEQVLADGADSPESALSVPPGKSFLRLGWAVAALLAVAGAASFWLARRGPSSPTLHRVQSLSIVLPAEVPFAPQDRPSLAISPDGARVVYIGGRERSKRLYSRDLNADHLAPIAQTEGAKSPFFSPDGDWLGFHARNSIQRIATSGGPAQYVAFAPPVTLGFDWQEDDSIILNPNKASGLYRVAPATGQGEMLTSVEVSTEGGHCWPDVLPDGRRALVSSLPPSARSWDEARILLVDLDTDESTLLIEGGSYARYVPTGHIVFARDGALLAVRFELSTGRLVGTAKEVLDALYTDPTTGVAHYDFSDQGTLVYIRFRSRPSSMRQLVWVDRAGKQESITEEPHPFAYPRLSPDGFRVLTTIEAATDDIWIYDLTRGVLQRITHAGRHLLPIWGPTPDSITYSAALDQTGYPRVMTRSVAGGEATPLDLGPRASFSGDWAPDGSTLAFVQMGEEYSWDIHLREPDGSIRKLFASQFNESAPAISPDGRWLAFVSDESGQYEVYVARLLDSDRIVQVSSSGGEQPVWSRSANRLFYRSARGLYEVAVEGSATPVVGAPVELFVGDYASEGTLPGYPYFDVAPGDQHFLMLDEEPAPEIRRIEVVLNWFADLERKVPST